MTNLLKADEAAERLGMSTETLAHWRWKKVGPPYVVIGRRMIRYPADKLEEYIEENTIKPLRAAGPV